MASAPFVGFGFGPIMGGLFLPEAQQSGAFGQLTVAEINADLVQSIRRSDGFYTVNIAMADGVAQNRVGPVEMLNPSVPGDADRLRARLAQASEAATALPSIGIFTAGAPSVADHFAAAIEEKARNPSLPALLVYTAENHNHAAEELQKAILARLSEGARAVHCQRALFQVLNTVIGKMSKVLPIGPEQTGLEPLVPEGGPGFLAEAFNRILISKVSLAGRDSALTAFQQKMDLLPFEHAKLYGHNAVHMLLGLLCQRRGLETVDQARQFPELIGAIRGAFLEEAGPGVIHAHAQEDHLFTQGGWRAYAEELVERMLNPYLQDSTERVVRDLPRKLAWSDRLAGPARLAIRAGVEPRRFRGAIGIACELQFGEPLPESALVELWQKDPQYDQEEALCLLGFLRKRSPQDLPD